MSGLHFLLSLLLTLTVCGTSNSTSRISENKELYSVYCASCHGYDGKLMLSEAPDLSVSKLTLEERIKSITEGGGMMPTFSEVITDDEIKAIAAYIDDLIEDN